MAKLNVEKALLKGFTREQIEQFAASRPDVELEGQLPLTRGELIWEGAHLPQRGLEIVGEKAIEALPEALDIEKHPSPSLAMNIAKGLPETTIDVASSFGQEFIDPISLGLMAAGGPLAKGGAKLLKGGAKGAGSLLSGVKAAKIGRLFEDPGALFKMAGPAKKAFGAAKAVSGIRALPKGKSVIQTPSEAFKALSEGRMNVAELVKKARKSGVAGREAQREILRSALQEEKIAEKTLEARQALGDLSKAKQVTPEVAILRNKLNAALETMAPAVRAADVPMSRALLGQEFRSFVPKDLLRRVISFGGIGGGFVNPAFASGAVATAPITTGLGTAALGTLAKGAKAATSTPLRRAIVGALLSRREEREDAK